MIITRFPASTRTQLKSCPKTTRSILFNMSEQKRLRIFSLRSSISRTTVGCSKCCKSLSNISCSGKSIVNLCRKSQPFAHHRAAHYNQRAVSFRVMLHCVSTSTAPFKDYQYSNTKILRVLSSHRTVNSLFLPNPKTKKNENENGISTACARPDYVAVKTLLICSI